MSERERSGRAAVASGWIAGVLDVALWTMAMRNVGRHRGRTAMTLAAIAFGVCALVLTGGFVADVYHQLGESLIRSHSGHLQIVRKGFFETGTRRPEEFVVDDPRALTALLDAQPEVQDAMARIMFSGLLNNGRADLPIVGEGIEPAAEARLGTSVRYVAGRALAEGDAFGAVLGKGLAQSLGVAPGDAVVLLATAGEGALNTLDLEVVGVFESFSTDYDARAVRIPLAAAQELLATAGANVVVAALHRTADTARVAAAVAPRLPAGLELRTWQEINDFYAKTVDLYDRQFGVLRLIVLLMVVLSVANSVNMSIFERTAEFGTMRALGRRGSAVFTLVVVENVVLGAIGGAVGVALGVALAALLSAIGIPMPPPPNANLGYVAKIRVLPASVLFAFLTAVAATVVAALAPARRAARIPVVDALREAV